MGFLRILSFNVAYHYYAWPLFLETVPAHRGAAGAVWNETQYLTHIIEKSINNVVCDNKQ